ncbi:terminase [Cupriavidus sp. 30B13]|uniref:terminase n=1 Tax=Cupriavidus sp. 30B13 TaxID=3384241 RepID=UPI003B8FE423
MGATSRSERARLERALQLARELKRRQPWIPLPGPQTMAYQSQAKIIGYGGAAGGGKTDLACGKALTRHRKAMMLRRVGTELTGIEDRLEELIGNKLGYNGQKKIWRTQRPDGRPLQIEFASLPNPGDERGYQGRPHDLLVFDEAANFLEGQVRFLLGWLRSVDPNQQCQALLTFNPPTSAEGRWIIDFFAPWLDPKHPCPAEPGELRWFAMVGGKEIEVVDGTPFQHDGETITPESRTFIPSRIADNPYLMGTGYMATLQALPEPLRSQMLYGDFHAGMEDDAMQVIPTAWVEAAMARWKRREVKPRMDSMGVDVARGGKDNTIISRRHGMWFDELLAYPGTQTPDGPTVAGLVIAARRDNAPIHIDVIGVGASPYDFLQQAGQTTIGVNVAEGSTATDKSGRLTFPNLRSQYWWQIREALDPAANNGIALPPDQRLLADLCAPRWRLQGKAICVESRDEIIKRIQRSPDYASALILALIDTPRREDLPGAHTFGAPPYDPYATLIHR